MTALEIVLLVLAAAAGCLALVQGRKARSALQRERHSELRILDLQEESIHLRAESRELKERQQTLQQSLTAKTKLAQAAEHTTDGACVCDAEGQIEWVNKAWEQTTGYALKDVRGKKPGQFLQGAETDQATVAKIREAIAGRKSVTVELMNYARDGSKLWVRLMVKTILDEKGALVGFLGIQTDLTLKRITQKRLERVHERAELALSAGNFGIWDWWPQPNHTEWDERCMRLHAMEKAAANYEEWMQLVHKVDLPAVEAHLRAVLLGKEQLKISFRLQQHPERHLEIRGQVLRDDQGTPLRMTGLVRDISDELALREQLHLSGERLRLSLRGANDGVWEWRIDENRMEIDEKWGQIVGLSHEASAPLTRQDFERLIHPEDLPLLRTVLDAHLANRTPHFEAECRIGQRHGDWNWVRWRGTVVAREPDGRPRLVCGTYTDVTEKRRTEEALRRSALLLRQMCQQMGIAAWEIEAENFNLHWTEELDLLHAAPPDFEPSLERFLSLYPQDSRKELSKALETALERGEGFDVEVRWRAPGSDKNLWFRWIGNPVLNEGRIVALCGLIHDVTAIHEGAAQRRELDARLAELHQYEALSAITDDLAYDLNSMLASLLGYLELAQDELTQEGPARRHLEESIRISNRTHDIIRQVLLLNRVKPAARIGLSPALLVEELAEELAGVLPAQVSLVRSIDRRCPTILGDAAQLQQAFRHIAHHAASRMGEEAGRLEVNLRSESLSLEQAAAIGMTIGGACACLEFRVTRDKLSDDEWSQLFDHPSNDPGLNLTTARKILGDHHGVLAVQFHPVHGGICRAWVPLAQTLQGMPASSAPIPLGHGECLWIVDSERFVAHLAKLTLERSGYQVECFRSVEDCIEALGAGRSRAAAVLLGSSVAPEMIRQLLGATENKSQRLPLILIGRAGDTRAEGRMTLLEEPFTAADLMRAVHHAMAPERSGSSLVKLGASE